MEARNKAIEVRKRSDWIRNISREQATSIAMAGVDRERFSEAVVEAFMSNPKLFSVDETSFCHAIRKCCQDGLIPDGVEAALQPGKGGQVTYMPMYIGLQRLIHRDLKAKIKSGVIYEKDKVKLEKRTDGPDVFEMSSDPFGDKGNLVGAWCYVEVPGRDGEVTLMNRMEIEQVRAKSRAAYEAAPWNQWYAQMAEKSVIKRAMKRVRYLIPRDSRLANAMAESAGETVETAEPFVVQEQVVEAMVAPIPKEPDPKIAIDPPTKAADVKKASFVNQAEQAEKRQMAMKHAEAKKAETPKPVKVAEPEGAEENYFDGDFEL